MHAVETPAQPLEGQWRQQRHDEAPQTNAFHPVQSAGNFLMADPQGSFHFSAEPAPMMFDGPTVALAASSTPGPEVLYPPNVGSSFDSSLHPDMSYPPPNGFAQSQNYSLSPGSFYGNGQDISPSHSVEHLSPEGSYMSDPSHQDPSTYTTPNFNTQVLDDFSGLTFAENGPSADFSSYQENLEPTTLTSSSLNTYNAQPSPFVNDTRLDPHHQLLSPSITHSSSPVVGDDNAVFASNNHYNGMLSTPPSHATQMQHFTPIKQTQSPALTNSPGVGPLDKPQSLMRHLTSPIVRVENYSVEESSSQSDNSRPISKRSFDSRRSGNHLSPYPQDQSSDDEGVQHKPIHMQPALQTHDRNDDGSWTTTGASGQAGLSPNDRRAMANAYVPSIDDIADQWAKNHKKLEVQEWLTKSEVGSEAGDVDHSNNFLKPIAGRRRAKSTNDVQRRGTAATYGLGVRTAFDQIDDGGIPGPGVYIDERSDYGEEEDDDEYSAEPESPPAAIDYETGHAQPSYFPALQDPVPSSESVVRPWVDTPSQSPNPSSRYQPPTSNAAMMRFFNRAKDIESASLAATVGSRRLSESDLGSIRAAPGVARLIEPDPKKQKERQRRPSFLENIITKRTPSNLLKRKSSIPVQQPQEVAQDKSKEPVFEKPKRIGSWGRPKSPRVDTNLSNSSKDAGLPSSTGLTSASGPWFRAPRNVIKRSRSRSDIGRSPGLAELMTQHGGPPMPMLASPLAETEATRQSVHLSPAGDDEDDEAEPVMMDLKVRTDPIIPSYEGFRTHARQLNPRLADFMVERITQEQMRRYKRLLDFRVKHLKAVESHSCSSNNSSNKFCKDLGGDAKLLPPRAGNKDADAPFIGFQVTAPGTSDDDGDIGPEGTVISAQFPSGVPLPPVKRLPAEFECPLCFKVKKFYKPSDWTKHVHEDVQPFTCTFPNCGEPKSFKRKADWVRHENERHRQLENWTCQVADCNHTCYRKDNFVQHLVREHKIAEPRQRIARAGNKDAAAGTDQDDIWTIVERCRRDTVKQPKDEPCRFCGNICNSWKKLTVHLAKHMEQISMPILTLVAQKQLNADSVISPVVELPDSRKLSITPSRSSNDNQSRYDHNPTFAPGIDPNTVYAQDVKLEAAANVMHTYPPPQRVPYRAPQSAQPNSYSTFAASGNSPYSNQTYPGVQGAPKPRNGHANGIQIPHQAYHPGTIQTGVEQYGMAPSAVIQQQQAMYTDSPVDATAFPSYYTQEPQDLTNNMPNMNYDSTNGIRYPQANTYPAPYLTTQHSYHYQNQ
ncbi:hypothetical protein NX059_004107 [Plenodomus lindquistii]|nr:hypothetical protein NX059_004107 [Plenodomus lindquistii]